MNIVQKCIDAAGGAQSLARILGTSIQRVVNWRLRDRVPADAVVQVAAATNWRVTPHELRPDIYPHPDDGLPPERRGEPRAEGEAA